mmetsp:Transcript_37314/g.64120  ORF Transcript_37314/g.64120 Transcript_37314/m.64120 type:complete len:511 (-) Transcript_37314:170-1702(-)
MLAAGRRLRRHPGPGAAVAAPGLVLGLVRAHHLSAEGGGHRVVLGHLLHQCARLRQLPLPQLRVDDRHEHLGQRHDAQLAAALHQPRRGVLVPRHYEQRAPMGERGGVRRDLVLLHPTQQSARRDQLARAHTGVQQRVVRASVWLERERLELRPRGEGAVEVAHAGAGLDDDVDRADRHARPRGLARLQEVVRVVHGRRLLSELVSHLQLELKRRGSLRAVQVDQAFERVQRLAERQLCEDDSHRLMAGQHDARLGRHVSQLEHELWVVLLLRLPHQTGEAHVQLPLLLLLRQLLLRQLLVPLALFRRRVALAALRRRTARAVVDYALHAAKLTLHVPLVPEEAQHGLVRLLVREAPLVLHASQHLVRSRRIRRVAVNAAVNVPQVRAPVRAHTLLTHLREDALRGVIVAGAGAHSDQDVVHLRVRGDAVGEQLVVQHEGGLLVARIDARSEQRLVREQVWLQMVVLAQCLLQRVQPLHDPASPCLCIDDAVERFYVRDSLRSEHLFVKP